MPRGWQDPPSFLPSMHQACASASTSFATLFFDGKKVCSPHGFRRCETYPRWESGHPHHFWVKRKPITESPKQKKDTKIDPATGKTLFHRCDTDYSEGPRTSSQQRSWEEGKARRLPPLRLKVSCSRRSWRRRRCKRRMSQGLIGAM